MILLPSIGTAIAPNLLSWRSTAHSPDSKPILALKIAIVPISDLYPNVKRRQRPPNIELPQTYSVSAKTGHEKKTHNLESFGAFFLKWNLFRIVPFIYFFFDIVCVYQTVEVSK